MVHLLYEPGVPLANRIQTGSGARPERVGSTGAYGQVVRSNASGSPGSNNAACRVLIAHIPWRTGSPGSAKVSRKPSGTLPKIPGRQWLPDRFAGGREALSVFARDRAEAKAIVRLCKEAGWRAWIYGRI
jgi:hypothetical protein